MPVNVGEIVDTIQACVAGSPTDQELAQLSGAITNIEAGDLYSVACTALLPDAEENIGRWVYVSDIGAYRYSNGEEWSNAYSTTCRIENRVYSTGRGIYGSMGDNTSNTTCNTTPVREVTLSTNWSSIYAAYHCTAGVSAIKTDGTLWGWGGNSNGILGIGCTVVGISSPTQEVCSSTNWCYVAKAAGSFGIISQFGFKTDGTMWGMGGAVCYVLMTGNTTSTCSPVQECTSTTDWLTGSIGECSSSAIKTDGSMWVIGRNDYGQLGMNNTTVLTAQTREYTSATNWCAVQHGTYAKSMLRTDGTLWGVGFNGVGQIGDGTITTRSSPTQEVCSSTSWCQLAGNHYIRRAIKTDGTLWMWGQCSPPNLLNSSTPVQEICSATNWCKVSGAASYTAAIKTDGTLWFHARNCCGVMLNTILIGTSVSSFISAVGSGGNDWTDIATGNEIFHGIRAVAVGFNEP